MARLEGKVAIVTGGASGIGAETARLFAREGAKVVVADRHALSGARLVAELNADGERARFFEIDVAEAAQWPALIGAAIEAFGGLHVLVNNAGISYRLDVEETDDEAWARTIAVNQTAVFYGVKHAIAAMKDGGAACSIVNLSSIDGIVAEPDFFAYCASKGAVALMTRAAALHCGRRGYPIRVNSVHPGYVLTAMADEDARQAGLTLAEYEAGFAARHPIGHLGRPEDIANGILYLASDESRFVTGSQLVIDGGYTAQ